MQIGQLAQRTGVAIDTVRYYERQGLLPQPQRRASGYRQYAEQDISRLRFIRRAKELGFSLQEIGELLALSNARDTDVARIKAATENKLREVERRIEELVRVRDGLRSLVEHCPGHGDPAACPILAALGGGTP
jgi:Hg(II)-responsive transcriptional regulator